MSSMTPKHGKILAALLKQVGKVDFQILAFPEIIELRAELKEARMKCKDPDGSYTATPEGSIAVQEMGKIEDKITKLKPTQKHFVVYGVDNLLNLCKANQWRLAAQHGRVYVYNGAYWQAVDENDLKQFLGQALEKMGVRFVDAKHFRFRDDLTKQFYTSAHLPAPERDRGTVCINLRNGTLSVGADGVQLREFRPEDFLRYQLAFDYDPAATAPKWQAFLYDVQPDIEVQRVLAEAAALAFVPSSALKLEKIPVLHGSGSNGKSVFQDTFRAVLGKENVSGHSLKLLTGNENARADLADKLINISSEIGGITDSDVFKLLASGEPVSAKILYEDVFTMEDYGRLLCNANKLPAEVENSHAFFRRFLIIPFSVTIDPAKKDTNLSKKIVETELPGVLNWILEGLARLLKQNDFSPCTAADQALQQYRHESNTVSLWLEDASYQGSTEGHEQPVKTLYDEYRQFCKDEGFRAVSSKTFSQRMQTAGFEKHRKSAGFVYFAVKVFSVVEGVQDGPF
jgi:putative DNA primase/helicase